MATESLLVRMKMDARQYNTQARTAATNTAAVGASAKTAGRAAGGLGTKLKGLASSGGGMLAVAGGAFAVKQALDGTVGAFLGFDDAMTQSLAIMGDVSEEMRTEMSDAARAVGRETTFAAEEAADAYFFLASAGLDAAAATEAMPQVAQFAQAGMFDLATATDLATDAQSALGLASDDAGENLENLTRVTDVFVKANTLANTSVQQISEAMTTKAGAALRSLGKDIEEGSAVLAAFADQGVKGAMAGTQFSIVLRDLQTKALQNKQAFSEMGVAVFDANGEMRNIADIIGDLEGALDGMSDAEQKSTLLGLGFSDKSVSAITTLLGTSDAIREYEEALRDAGGTTEEVADKQLESLSKQFGLALGQIADIGIEIGNELVPAIKLAVDGLGLVAEGLQVFTADTDVERLGIQIGTAADNAAALATHMLELNKPLPLWMIDKDALSGSLRNFIEQAELAPSEIRKVLDNMDFLTETMGLGAEEAEFFAEVLRGELTRNLTDAEIAARDAVGGYLEHKEATKEAAAGLNDAEQAARDFFNSSGILGGHLKNQGGKWDDVVTSMENYEDMLRRLTDPVFRAIDDQRNLEQAHQDYLDAVENEAPIDELEGAILDLIEAEIAARGSSKDLDENVGIAGETMEIVAEQAGVLDEHLGFVDDAISRLDGRRIDVEFRLKQTGAPFDADFLLPEDVLPPIRHSGGPGRAGTPYRIRPDEEIFVPSGNGEFLLNNEVLDALKGLSSSSNTTTTNTYNIPVQSTGDPNTDAQLVGSISSVLRRMETR